MNQQPLRCPSRGCTQRFGDFLDGRLETMCPKCKGWVRFTRRGDVDMAVRLDKVGLGVSV